MKTLLPGALSRAFTRLPAPVLALAAVALAFFFTTDLAIPDALPFVDEAVLALLLTGVLQELIGRRRIRSTDAPDPV